MKITYLWRHFSFVLQFSLQVKAAATTVLEESATRGTQDTNCRALRTMWWDHRKLIDESTALIADSSLLLPFLGDVSLCWTVHGGQVAQQQLGQDLPQLHLPVWPLCWGQVSLTPDSWLLTPDSWLLTPDSWLQGGLVTVKFLHSVGDRVIRVGRTATFLHCPLTFLPQPPVWARLTPGHR